MKNKSDFTTIKSMLQEAEKFFEVFEYHHDSRDLDFVIQVRNVPKTPGGKGCIWFEFARESHRFVNVHFIQQLD